MAQPVFYTYSGAFIPGTLARAEAEATEFTAVQVGFDKLAIQGVDTGAANAYVVTTSGGQNGAYTDGMVVEFKAVNANTGGSTIAVDSGATVSITTPAGQALSGGAITANTWYTLRYNSTYVAWTLIAPSSTVITSNTISGAAPTHLVGLTPAGGVSTACAPIDVTFALDQTISPTMTGTWAFSGAVSFNSTVSFASGFTLTGGANAYAITLDGSATPGQSYGVEINAGTNASDIAFLVNKQGGGTQFFEIVGTGGVTVGAPTGGSQGLGTLNATGLFVNGAAVQTSAASSHNPTATIGLSAVNGSAATFMTSDSAPPLSQAIVPTWTGAHTFTPSSAVTAVTINAAANTIGFAVVGGTNTALHYLASFISGQASGFSGGVIIEAGTNASDYALNIANAAASSNLFYVTGAGLVAAGTGPFYNSLEAAPQFVMDAAGSYYGYLGNRTTGIWAFGYSTSLTALGTSIMEWNVSGPQITGYGPVAASQVDMTPDQGTFQITYTGMTASVTGTAVWTRVGNLVVLYFPAALGTSNTATMTATGMPAAIRPARVQNFSISGCIENNTGAAWSTNVVSIATGGTVTFTNAALGVITGGSFTNSGTKGVAVAFTVSYLLN
jgi:hypothetical protein